MAAYLSDDSICYCRGLGDRWAQNQGMEGREAHRPLALKGLSVCLVPQRGRQTESAVMRSMRSRCWRASLVAMSAD